MIEHWWLSPEVRGPLEDRAPLDVAAWMHAAADAQVLSSDRSSVTVRVPGTPPLLVKWRRPRKGRGRRTFLRPSRERREARAYLRMGIRGIRAPFPWGVGERRRAGVLVGAVLVRRFREDFVDAAQLGTRTGDTLVELGSALRRWHDAGFRHGDCYPKNILLPEAGGAPLVIGCPAARFLRPGVRIDPWRKKDLAQWAAGVHALQPDDDPFAFLESYAAAPDMPLPASLRDMLRPYFEKILAKKAKRRRTQAAREAEGPLVPTPLPERGPPGPRVKEHEIESLVLGDPALDL